MSSSLIKGLVSKKKKRYQKDGFDLDLSFRSGTPVGKSECIHAWDIGKGHSMYAWIAEVEEDICGNVIAMGFPGENIEALYRNNIDEVCRFLETKHRDKYKIYNLCSERSYDPQKFKGRVAHFPFKDHNPPNLSIIPRFCSDVQSWLNSNPDNVAVVHCKAGKGRTGVMICCYLLHCSQVSTANAAMNFYATERTHDSKGVTIPSQRRYVEYYERILKSPELLQYLNRPVLLLELTLEGTISTTGTIFISITQSGTEDYKYSSGHAGIEWKKTGGAPFTIALSEALSMRGDIKVELFVRNMMTKQRLCHFWFNTFFIDKDPNFRTELSTGSANNRTTARLSLRDTPKVRHSSDNVRELERTLSCPPPVDPQRSSFAEQWSRLDENRSDDTKRAPVPSMHLTFQKSHLDKANKNLITNKSNFRISLSFSEPSGEDTCDGPISPSRCFRSNSDTNTTQPTPPTRYSSSSSSSSCTDDDVSSEGSGDSTGALMGSRVGKHYKL